MQSVGVFIINKTDVVKENTFKSFLMRRILIARIYGRIMFLFRSKIIIMR